MSGFDDQGIITHSHPPLLHQGPMCGDCLPGYGHTGEGVCKECGGFAVSIIYYLCGLCIVLLPIVLTVK